MDAHDALAAWHIEHVAPAQQLLGALLAQDGARVDLRGDVEADPGREVRLDDAGDDVHRGALRRHDQVDARRARLLREALDQEFDFLARRHHQVGQFVDDHHDLRQRLVFELFLLIDRLAGLRVIARLDLAPERLALGFGRAHLVVEAGEAAHANRGHLPIAVLHRLDGPFQRADRLGGIGDDRRQQMRDVVIHRQFQHLGVDHDHPALLGRQPVEQRQDHAVETHRLTRTRRTRDQQVRHRREVGDHRVARDILAQDDRQLRGLIGEALRRDQFVQRHHLALGIRQFDADDVAPRNHRDAR